MGPPREKPAQLPKDIPGMPRVVAKGPREVAG